MSPFDLEIFDVPNYLHLASRIASEERLPNRLTLFFLGDVGSVVNPKRHSSESSLGLEPFDFDKTLDLTIKDIPRYDRLALFDEELHGFIVRLVLARLEIKRYVKSLDIENPRNKKFCMAYATITLLQRNADGLVINPVDQSGGLVPLPKIAPFDARRAIKAKGANRVLKNFWRLEQKAIRDRYDLQKLKRREVYVAIDKFNLFAFEFNEYTERKLEFIESRAFGKTEITASETYFASKRNRIKVIRDILNWRVTIDLRKLISVVDIAEYYTRDDVRKMIKRGRPKKKKSP